MAYDYSINVGGVALSTLVTHARFRKWTSGTRRGSDLIVPYKHGEVFIPDKYYAGNNVILEVYLPFGDHDEAAEALSLVSELFSSQDQVIIDQIDPYRGNIRAKVELMTDPIPTQNDFIYQFTLRNALGVWEDASTTTAASANPPVVTTLGDRPINDMVLTFAAAGFLEHTDSLGITSRITLDSGVPANTIVRVGPRTVRQGATSYSHLLTVDQPWWMKWQPDEAQSFTSNVAVEATWRNKWA